MTRPFWSYGIPGEIRAGRADARRTRNPRPWHGMRYGDVFYAAGFVAGCIR